MKGFILWWRFIVSFIYSTLPYQQKLISCAPHLNFRTDSHSLCNNYCLLCMIWMWFIIWCILWVISLMYMFNFNENHSWNSKSQKIRLFLGSEFTQALFISHNKYNYLDLIIMYIRRKYYFRLWFYWVPSGLFILFLYTWAVDEFVFQHNMFCIFCIFHIRCVCYIINVDWKSNDFLLFFSFCVCFLIY